MEWQKRTACISVKVGQAIPIGVWERFQQWEHALGAWETTGEWDYLLWLDVKDWEEMHRWVMEIRSWPGVTSTSSRMVYAADKNGAWWWQEAQGVWVWARQAQAGQWKEPVKRGWAVSSFTLPGDWDSLCWVQGKNWDEVWDRTRNFRTLGWETTTSVPMRTWWNRKRLETWK